MIIPALLFIAFQVMMWLVNVMENDGSEGDQFMLEWVIRKFTS